MFAVQSVSALHALGLFQQDAINSGNSHLLMLFVGMCAVAFLIIAAAIVILVVEILKTRTKVMTIVADLHGKATPIIDTSTKLLHDLGPKVQEITANVQHITYVTRNKVEEFEPTLAAANLTVKDANAKTHEQIIRVNEIITNVLNSTNEIVDKVDAGIKAPFREASGVWAGVKAGVGTFFNGQKTSTHRTYERETAHHSESAAHSAHAQHDTPATAAAAAAVEAFARAETRDTSL